MKKIPVILRVKSNRPLKDSAKAHLHRAVARHAGAHGGHSIQGGEQTTTHHRRLDIEAMPSYPGMLLDHTYAAVPDRVAHAHKHRDIEEIVDSTEHFTVRAHVHLEDSHHPPHQAGDAEVFAEMRLHPFVNRMTDPAFGTAQDVASRLDVAGLKLRNLTGDGVAIAILDTGINLLSLTKSLGYQPRFDGKSSWNPHHDSREPGTWRVGHGTMCAYDALIAAPEATLVDFPILEVASASADGMMFPYVSSAMMAYGALLASRAHGPLKQYRALVASNSWGIYHPDDDYPAGHPGRFCDNPDHPFNVQLAVATRAGIDVLFSAGNCGKEYPANNCFNPNRVANAAIVGCAGLSEILTIAGCDTQGVRAGFSSQGPSIAGMTQEKPDLTAYTHFLGSALTESPKPDTGTSAACPVAAGCVAALRSSPKAGPEVLPTAQLFDTLRKTAAQSAGKTMAGWDGDYGWGIISPINAANQLDL